LEHRVFRPVLGIAVFVGTKRLVGYLSGGVLVAVTLLLSGYLAYLTFFYEYEPAKVDDNNPAECMAVVGSDCAIETVSVNLSEIGPCGGNVSYEDIKDLDSVEDVNESTGVVSCQPPLSTD
jgi:hypothetical protein